MKKLLSITIVGMALLASSNSVFAANAVSKMATTKGGQHVAECAKTMNKGISECAKLPECN
jgi:hypothetical protein